MQGALAFGGVPAPAGQDGQRVLEPLEQLLGREQARAGRGQLDRERKPVQAAADRVHGRERLRVGGAGLEERDRVLLGQRLDRVLVLARDPSGRAR